MISKVIVYCLLSLELKTCLFSSLASYLSSFLFPLLSPLVSSPIAVLASEGFKAPFIAFIRKGECMVLRQVQARKTLANGKVERRNCQVVVGRLKFANSFGEVSMLDDVPMTCTVVTETAVELGVIEESSLNLLDDDTRKLIRQSSKPTFGQITQVSGWNSNDSSKAFHILKSSRNYVKT